MSETDFARRRLPWLRSGFDLEGYVGALAAWLVGILLGILWGPLFWIGFLGALVILFATRTAERTPPLGEDLIVAPIDGLVVSVGAATPPDELRLEGTSWTRVRVSVGPTKTNGVHAPMDGAIDHIISEAGDPAAFAAMQPDRPGLAVAYVALESGDRELGLRLATGGLGPRLELRQEAGDAVRLGRNIGTLRLGGWYDLYVPATVEVQVLPGQTLIGSETLIGTFDTGTPGQVIRREEGRKASEAAPTPSASDDDMFEDEDEHLTLERLAGTDPDPESNAPKEEDVSEMFARLRKQARRNPEADGD